MSKEEERALEAYPKMSRIAEPHGVIPSDYESHYIGDANEEKRIGFVEGYRQAEKDLIENIHEKSWRLDEQLWSGFKDIEDASYQYIYDASNDWAYEIPTWGDVQDAFKAGSEWKENIELTLEDIKTIDKLLNQCVDCNNPYQEVLKQFKNYKERE